MAIRSEALIAADNKAKAEIIAKYGGDDQALKTVPPEDKTTTRFDNEPSVYQRALESEMTVNPVDINARAKQLAKIENESLFNASKPAATPQPAPQPAPKQEPAKAEEKKEDPYAAYWARLAKLEEENANLRKQQRQDDEKAKDQKKVAPQGGQVTFTAAELKRDLHGVLAKAGLTPDTTANILVNKVRNGDVPVHVAQDVLRTQMSAEVSELVSELRGELASLRKQLANKDYEKSFETYETKETDYPELAKLRKEKAEFVDKRMKFHRERLLALRGMDDEAPTPAEVAKAVEEELAEYKGLGFVSAGASNNTPGAGADKTEEKPNLVDIRNSAATRPLNSTPMTWAEKDKQLRAEVIAKHSV